jgi:hypothetical protein
MRTGNPLGADQRMAAVITTVQPPTRSVRKFARVLSDLAVPLIVVGDAKGPSEYEIAGAELLTLSDQLKLPYSLARVLPTSHYARKNLGFLEVIRRGANCIYETDDDNSPLPTWRPRSPAVKALAAPRRHWLNVYRCFSDHTIWPRGFPVELIRDPATAWFPSKVAATDRYCPIQQSLVDGSPDVDAIWRLVYGEDATFAGGPSIWLPEGTWCPFNSQSTWWWKETFHLMYLPSLCSFRVTDIWRSLVAQRCLWATGKGLVFHQAEVRQARNEHNLLEDLRQEVPGLLQNSGMVACLERLDLPSGLARSNEAMLLCYQALIDAGYMPAREIELVKMWLADLAGAAPRQTQRGDSGPLDELSSARTP